MVGPSVKKGPQVDVPPVDVPGPQIVTDPEGVPIDTFEVLLSPTEYRNVRPFSEFFLSPQLRNAVLGEARGRVYVLDGCFGYFHFQEHRPASAFDNAVKIAAAQRRTVAILVDPEQNRLLCSVTPELNHGDVRLMDDSSTQYAGTTVLQNTNGRFVGNRRIEAVITADGRGLVPYQEPRDILAHRIAFRHAGDTARTVRESTEGHSI